MAGDVDSQIQLAWIAAQDLWLLYRASSREQAEERLFRWMVHCADSDIPELHRLV